MSLADLVVGCTIRHHLHEKYQQRIHLVIASFISKLSVEVTVDYSLIRPKHCTPQGCLILPC
jgi:hypothetical protein